MVFVSDKVIQINNRLYTNAELIKTIDSVEHVVMRIVEKKVTEHIHPINGVASTRVTYNLVPRTPKILISRSEWESQLDVNSENALVQLSYS